VSWKAGLVAALILGSCQTAAGQTLPTGEQIPGGSAAVPDRSASRTRVLLDVPYVTQGLDLCGGAAAAMVMRYWGDAPATAEDFAALVDDDASGIRASVLVEDLGRRGWQALAFRGSRSLVQGHLARGRPIIVLVDSTDRAPHYVVVTGWVAGRVIVQDPSLGPLRHLEEQAFLDAWERAGRWSLLLLPGNQGEAADAVGSALRPTAEPASFLAPATVPVPLPEACRATSTRAIELARNGDLDGAARLMDEAIARCPRAPSLQRERASIFLLQERCADAAASAVHAARQSPEDELTWEILATARYLCGDASAALDAWNHIGLPRVGDVTIHGLERTPYELTHAVLGMETGDMLTGDALILSRRRAAELPALGGTRVDYRMEASGDAGLDVFVRERSTVPSVPLLLARGITTGTFQQRIDIPIANARGWGELVNLGGRWREGQESAIVELALPRVRAWADVWTVRTLWEHRTVAAEASAPPEESTRWVAGLEAAGWARANLRWHAGAAFESWRGRGRFASVRTGLEHRLFRDHLALHGDVEGWAGPGTTFGRGRASVRWISTTSETEPIRISASVGFDGVTRDAPTALWTAADLGRDTSIPLRAHSVYESGVITGPALGPRLWHATTEARRWIASLRGARLGAAVFADIARPLGRPDGVDRALVDAGLGLRIGLPGGSSSLRVDVARGLVDGTLGVSIGWQDAWGVP